MQLPEIPSYLVKWPDETIWIAWITALAGVVSAVLIFFDVPNEIVVGIGAFILATGRLITATFMPSPTRSEAVADAREHTEPAR